MRLSIAIRLFVQSHENARTRQGYEYTLGKFRESIGDFRLKDITPEIIDDWYANQRSQGLAAATITGRLKKIKAFANWCMTRGYVPVTPTRFIHIKKLQRSKLDKAMPTAVVTRLIAQAQEGNNKFLCARNAALLAFLIEYGLRATDAANMTLAGLGEGRFQTTVKGGKLHILPFTQPVLDLLDPWLLLRRQLEPDPPHDRLWVNYRTAAGHRYQPLDPAAISLMVRKLTQQLGHNYGAHSIRHWRGQSLADARIPPTVVQAVLGHSSVTITLEYYYNQGDDRIAQVLRDFTILRPLKEDNIIRFPQISTDEQVVPAADQS